MAFIRDRELKTWALEPQHLLTSRQLFEIQRLLEVLLQTATWPNQPSPKEFKRMLRNDGQTGEVILQLIFMYIFFHFINTVCFYSKCSRH